MEEIILTRAQALNDKNSLVTSIDPIRGVRNAYNSWGGAHAATALVTLASAAPGAARGRVVAIGLYATAATIFLFTDNAAGIFIPFSNLGLGQAFLGPEELGQGGIVFTTDFTIDPDVNSAIAWIAWIPEYDNPE